MAVESEVPKNIKEYLPKHTRSSALKLAFFSLVIPVLFFAYVALLDNSNFTPLKLGLIVLSYLLTLGISLLALSQSLKPLKDLLSTITYLSGEPTDKPPLKPHDPKYAGTGLETAINSLYELSRAEASAKLTSEDDDFEFVYRALDNSRAGFVIMQAGKVVYANASAPIVIDNNGAKKLKLLFQDNDSLEQWLEYCKANEVKADKIWTRIPNTLPEEENCRYYDVLASYSKESSYELVLNLIDRTAIYASTEEELNFIAFAAHELRGPITVIKGYLDVLSGELGASFTKDQAEMFERLKVSANRLSSYINNILNTSKYDRRHLKLSLAEDKVASVYDVIRDDMATRASTQKRVLNVSIPDNLPTIAADRASLSEVFSNLIDNAIKYSREGSVINVIARTSGDNVEISVQDFGIGMPANVISNLFGKFYRSHRSRETVAGTGIGLYISKAIVESHGGTITVRSQEGKGSVFSVILPTYQIMSTKLAQNQSNEGIIAQGSGWIKNHSTYRG